MAFLTDSALDAALDYVRTNGTRVDICSQEPTTYAEATSTYSLGNDTSITVSANADASPNGRKVSVTNVGGSVTASSATSATHFAITNNSNALIATGSITTPQTVSPGNTFSFSSGFDITIPDAT